ncbi:MAG: hypothetical protein ACYSUV_01955 [Planctomycetota bacterium]
MAPAQTSYEPPQPPPGAQRRLALKPEEILAGVEAHNADAGEQNTDEKGPKTEKDILNNLFSQAFARWTKRSESNRGVESIAEVVSHIQGGTSLKEMQDNLSQVLGEQQSKATLLQATMFNHQMERVALHWDMRWQLERDLWQDLREQKMNVAEKLALLKLSCCEAEKSADYINDHSTSFTPLQEVEPVVERASKPATDKDRVAQRKEFEGTTPQGREIIRRMTAKAKSVSEKIVEKAKEDGTNPNK